MTKNTFALLMLSVLLSLPVAGKMRCTTVYMFGASASFSDSIVYFTDIQVVDSVWLDEKTDFLVSRWDYSNQLRSHFTQTGHPNRTCIVCYSTEEKDIRKKYAKMRKKFSGTTKKPTRYDIRQLDEEEFTFAAVRPSVIDEESLEAYNEQQAREAMKPQKQQKPPKKSRGHRPESSDDALPPSMPPRQ